MALGTMTRDKALQIFNDNALLIGERNVIPVETIIKLFGAPALEHAQIVAKESFNEYWIDNKTSVKYGHMGAFMAAATYYNIITMQSMQKGAKNGKTTSRN